MNQYLKFALWGLTSLLVIGACQKNSMESRQDPLDIDYKLIDKGDYDGAIRELQNLAAQDSRPAVKVALASAYAARGGVRVENYWGFVIGFNAPLMNSAVLPGRTTVESFQKFAKQAKGLDPRDLNSLGAIVNTMTVWERYKDRVDAIPVVSGAALADVQIAVEILKPVQTPGGRLYRAILNLILFKSYVIASDAFLEQFGGVIEDVLNGRVEALCKFNFEQILTWLNPITYHLLEALEDLTMAYPADKKDLELARQVIQTVYELTQEGVSDLRKKRTCAP